MKKILICFILILIIFLNITSSCVKAQDSFEMILAKFYKDHPNIYKESIMKINNIDKIYGCIEIKEVNYTLLNVKDIIEKVKLGIELRDEEGQLLGEVLWYRKVLYTNGIRWMYYEWENIDKNDWDYIKKLVKTRINMEKEYRTKENIDSRKSVNLSNFNYYNKIKFENININEVELISLSNDIKDDQWNDFINKVHNIKWDK